MGGGKWTSNSYADYSVRTNYRSLSQQETFAKREDAEFCAKNIQLRESCDSEDNPNSTPVILALDMTGSMGAYAHQIARDQLPIVMTKILENKPISDPHLMFMGLDDVHGYPHTDVLQVSQFEADIRILEQLRKLYPTGRGGGNNSESYDLPWVFAANYTRVDSMLKRGKKGYLFTMGDECAPYEVLTAAEQEVVLHGSEFYDLTPAQSLEMACKSWNVFHIVIEEGSYARYNPYRVASSWTELLGPNALFLRDFTKLSDLIQATLEIAEGADMSTVIEKSACPAILKHAFKNALGEVI